MPPSFPRARWAAVVWLAVWLPAYVYVWGWINLLNLCDIAVILTCAGLWRGSSLLLSSQAVSSIPVDALWCVDLAWRLVWGRHLIGGTEYMWDPQYPLAVRLLSLFHFFWPVLLIWALRRVGYDRRGVKLQAAIAVVAMTIARWTPPERNINFAHRDAIYHRAWGPAPAHVALMLGVLLGVLYLPTHLALSRALGGARRYPPKTMP
jgi:hypothetical protein